MALGCTLDELGQRMSLDEFHLWQQFDQDSPLPDLRSDIQTAHLVQTVANMSGKAVKEPLKLADVLLFHDQKRQASSDIKFFKDK